MGMFDRLYVETELPLNDELKKLQINWKEEEFQTKDLDCFLTKYKIQEDGTLCSFGFGGIDDDLPDEELEKTWKEEKYHGTINFYTGFYGLDGFDWWVEFIAYFSYGKLDKIELTEATSRSSAERVLREAEIYEKLNTRKKTLRSKLRIMLVKIPGYRRAIRGLVSMLHTLVGAITRFLYSWS
jgi:hypothetical protein